MQVPPISPVTQLSGSGLGQKGSALKLGAASGFPASCGPAAGSMLTRPMPRARPSPMVPANATRLSAMAPPLGDQSLWNAQYDHQEGVSWRTNGLRLREPSGSAWPLALALS